MVSSEVHPPRNSHVVATNWLYMHAHNSVKPELVVLAGSRLYTHSIPRKRSPMTPIRTPCHLHNSVRNKTLNTPHTCILCNKKQEPRSDPGPMRAELTIASDDHPCALGSNTTSCELGIASISF